MKAHVTRQAQDLKVLRCIMVMIEINVMNAKIELPATFCALFFFYFVSVRTTFFPALPEIMVFASDRRHSFFDHLGRLFFAEPESRGFNWSALFTSYLLGFGCRSHLCTGAYKRAVNAACPHRIYSCKFSGRQAALIQSSEFFVGNGYLSLCHATILHRRRDMSSDVTLYLMVFFAFRQSRHDAEAISHDDLVGGVHVTSFRYARPS